MLQYVHHSPVQLKLPSREGIQRRVMKLGEEMVEGIQEMFKVESCLFKFNHDLMLEF